MSVLDGAQACDALTVPVGYGCVCTPAFILSYMSVIIKTNRLLPDSTIEYLLQNITDISQTNKTFIALIRFICFVLLYNNWFNYRFYYIYEVNNIRQKAYRSP
jgi:hypothetical protein